MPKPKKIQKKIPLPPTQDASWEEQAAYFEKYSLSDLKEVGHIENMTEDDLVFAKKVQEAALRQVSKRKNREQLNISFQSDQLAEFIALAKRKHIPPSTLAKSWILERLDKESEAS